MIIRFLELSNTLTALVGCCMLMLCLRGFVYEQPEEHRKDHAANWFRRSLSVFLLIGLVRMGWWDIVWPIAREASGLNMPWFLLGGINAVFNFVVVYAVFCALKALYFNIPENRRHEYNLLTAPWAPDQIRSWRLWK